MLIYNKPLIVTKYFYTLFINKSQYAQNRDLKHNLEPNI